ncbi:MAG: hypothetical protein ACT4OL_12455, partial [Nitrospiraceae bacterium]
EGCVSSTAFTLTNGPCSTMADTTALYAFRFPDGSVSLYVDEQYAKDRGIDPANLVRVEIPREMFINGSVQEIREYVAVYIEMHQQKTGTA